MRSHAKASSAAPIQVADRRQVRIGLACLMALGFVAFWGIGAPSAGAVDTCPNAVFRSGPSAKLPDCRAYELVTLPYAGGAQPTYTGLLGDLPGMFATNTVTPAGDSVVYNTVGGGLPGFSATGRVDRYRSRRTAQGWITEAISPGGDLTRFGAGPGGISSDHEYSVGAAEEPTAALWPDTDSIDFIDMLRTPNGYEPVARGSLGFAARGTAHWITAGGTHVIFISRKKLEPAAEEFGDGFTAEGNLYDRTPGGPTHVLSLLPDGTSAGTTQFLGATKDGTEVAFFREEAGFRNNILVRRDNEVTEDVNSGTETTFDGIFNGRVFYGDANLGTANIDPFGNLYMYDLDEEKTTTIEGGDDASIINVSEDGSHVYFVAKSALTGPEQNQYGATAVAPAKGTGTLSSEDTLVSGVSAGEGTFQPGMAISGEGIPGQTTVEKVGPGTITLSKKATASGSVSLSASAPNLYVWSQAEESTKFIATVSQEDVETGGQNGTGSLNTWAVGLTRNFFDKGRAITHARETSDGMVFAFESTAQLTGFDNTEASAASCADPKIGDEPCDEVYRYDLASEELTCVSCGSGAGPASGEARLQSVNMAGLPTQDVQPATPNSPVESLTADGKMVFFESTQGLVPGDGNQTKDVYRWKQGEGVALISSGQGTDESALYGVTPNGSDVIFGTREGLLPQDENGSLVRLYDARVNGGFPPPEETVTEPCAGDLCQGQSGAAPDAPSIASGSLVGEGNVATKLRCRRGTRKVGRQGRERCVKRKRSARHHRDHRKAGSKRRTGR